jgi:hypothetical protein
MRFLQHSGAFCRTEIGMFPAVVFLFVVSSCATPIVLYDGPKRAPAEIATLQIGGSAVPNDLLYKVDGKYGDAFLFGQHVYAGNGAFDKSITIELLPGEHVIDVGPGRSSPAVVARFIAKAGRRYVIKGKDNDCIQIVDDATKEAASAIACPDLGDVLCAPQNPRACATLKNDNTTDGHLILYKVDGKWNSKAHLGWNYFNSSWDGSIDIKLPAGEHSLEIGWTGAGKFSEKVRTVVVKFEANNAYAIGAIVTQDTWSLQVKPAASTPSE